MDLLPFRARVKFGMLTRQYSRLCNEVTTQAFAIRPEQYGLRHMWNNREGIGQPYGLQYSLEDISLFGCLLRFS